MNFQEENKETTEHMTGNVTFCTCDNFNMSKFFTKFNKAEVVVSLLI